jgi:hypothetical protein
LVHGAFFCAPSGRIKGMAVVILVGSAPIVWYAEHRESIQEGPRVSLNAGSSCFRIVLYASVEPFSDSARFTALR